MLRHWEDAATAPHKALAQAKMWLRAFLARMGKFSPGCTLSALPQESGTVQHESTTSVTSEIITMTRWQCLWVWHATSSDTCAALHHFHADDKLNLSWSDCHQTIVFQPRQCTLSTVTVLALAAVSMWQFNFNECSVFNCTVIIRSDSSQYQISDNIWQLCVWQCDCVTVSVSVSMTMPDNVTVSYRLIQWQSLTMSSQNESWIILSWLWLCYEWQQNKLCLYWIIETLKHIISYSFLPNPPLIPPATNHDLKSSLWLWQSVTHHKIHKSQM